MTSVRTQSLQVEVELAGPETGRPLLLLHGWPDDATTWNGVVPHLHDAGFRTIAPMLRGFGGTRFLEERTARTANVGILALDALDLLDALKVDTCLVAGHDWGSNVAETLAVGWPERFPAIAMLSTPSRLGGLQTPPFAQVRRQWYHWFQSTERGAEAVAKDGKGFARIMWETWSPEGWFDEATFAAVARSFSNPDWTAITLHSYRSRWGEAPYDRRSVKLEALVAETKRLSTPTTYLQGAVDGVNPPETGEAMHEKFSGQFERIVLPGVGHFPTREAPADVAAHLLRHFTRA